MPQDNAQNAPQPKQPEPVFQWTLEQLKGIFFPLNIILFPLVFALAVCGWIYRWLCIHPWMKLAAFPVLLVFPAAFFFFTFGGFGFTYVIWSHPVSPEEAAQYESPLRELVCPVLTEKYALEECEVMYTRPARYRQKVGISRFIGMLKDTGGSIHFKIVSADHKRRIEIAQDIIRMKRELPGLPKCPYVLEFDHPRWFDDFTPDGAKDFSDPAARAVIAAIVIPDEKRGYDGRGDWHFDDFTPTPGEDEEARQ